MSQRITIEIKNKIATCLTELPVVCGNADYEVEFAFDEEWNEHEIKTATFVVNGELELKVFSGNVCEMPVLQNTLIARIGVFAGTIDDGTLSTSTPAIVHCKPSATCGNATPAPPKDDVYNQIIKRINEIETPKIDTSELVPITRTVNGKTLDEDITLTAKDVGALTSEDIDEEMEERDAKIEDLETGVSNHEERIASLEENPVDENAVSEAVSSWLEEHPEVTTTIANKSITRDKIGYQFGLYDMEGKVLNYFDKSNYEMVIGKGYYDNGNQFNNNNYTYLKFLIPSGKTYSSNCVRNPYTQIITKLDGTFIESVGTNKTFSVKSSDRFVYLIITVVLFQDYFNSETFALVEGEYAVEDIPVCQQKITLPWLAFGFEKDDIPAYFIEGDKLKQKMPPYMFDGIGCTNYFDADYNISKAEIYPNDTRYYYTAWNYLPAGTYTINKHCYSYSLKSIDGVITDSGHSHSLYDPLTFTITEDTPFFKAMIFCSDGVEHFRDIIITKGETVPENSERKYVLENFATIDIDFYPTHWNGKNYVAIGDSITRGYAPTEAGIAGGSQITPCYADYVAGKLHMNLKNLGVDGATVRTTLENNKIEVLQNEGFIPDVVTIYLGANDMVYFSLGTVDDEYTSYTDCTFCAGLKQIIKEIQDAFPMCTIILIGSTPTQSRSDEKIKQYNQAKKEIAEKYNVLYYDLYNQCGFNLNNETIVNKFKLDDIHPNRNAHLVMGSRITGFIASH